MTATAAQFQAKVDKTVTNMDRFDQIVNGSTTTDVVTDNGPVPSFAKLQAQNQIAIDDATDAAAAAAVSATTSAAWAEGSGAPGGTGTKSAKSWVNYLLADAGFAAVAADMVLGATSKLKAIGTDLLSGASVISAVAADLALGAGSYIKRAPQAATDAASSATAASGYATAAANSAASVPTGAATYTEGRGAPGANVGTPGAYYFDLDSSYLYGPKTAAGWPTGKLVAAGAAQSRTIYEFRYGAAFPSTALSLTRASPSTNLTFQDVPGFGYSTFANNAAVLHPIRGLGLFPSATNYFLNSAAPVNQTITLAAGTYYVWGNGTDTITSAAGTAVGTGFGALNLSAQTYQTLVITTGGTVTFTRANTGTWLAFQVESSTAANAMPTPLILTTGAAVLRLADVMSITGAMLSCLQSATGTFIVQTYNIGAPYNTFRNPSILALVTGALTYTALGMGSDPKYLANNNSTGPNTIFLGNSDFSSRVRTAITWSGTTSTIGGGDYLPTPLASTLLNGTARDGARLGCFGTSTTGANSLGGWIERIETLPTRLSDADLYAAYSSWAPPASTTLFANRGPKDLPMFRKAKALVDAGQRDAILCIMSSSHGAGAYPTTDVKRNNWPWLMSTILTSRGYPTWPYAYTGNSIYPVTAGANVYDPYVTFSSGWSFSAGTAFGGRVLQTTTSGATMTHAIPPNTNSFTVKSYTGAGYGSFTITANGGAVLMTVNCNGTAGTQLTTVTVPLGVNSFTITTTSAAKVAIAWTLPNDTTYSKILLFNGSMGGFSSVSLSLDSGSENSYLSGLRELAPDLTIMQGPITNDIASGTTATNYLNNLRAIYAAATISGSVFMMNDPPSDPAARATASQVFYSNLMRSLAWEKGVPFADVYGIGLYAALQPRGYYGDTVHENAAGNALVATLAADMITLP